MQKEWEDVREYLNKKSLKERDRLGETGLNDRIILKWILKK